MNPRTLVQKSKDTCEEAIKNIVEKLSGKLITTTKTGDFSNPPSIYIRNKEIIEQILNDHQ